LRLPLLDELVEPGVCPEPVKTTCELDVAKDEMKDPLEIPFPAALFARLFSRVSNPTPILRDKPSVSVGTLLSLRGKNLPSGFLFNGRWVSFRAFGDAFYVTNARVFKQLN